MRPLPAADICRAVGGTFLQTGGGTVTGVTSDSRQIASGDLCQRIVDESLALRKGGRA